MKKRFIAVGICLIMGFVWAVGLCVQALATTPVSAFSKGALKVVVDAGHGGIDGGVSGSKTKVKESDLNLAIALELRECLEEAGFAVTLTRKTDAGLYGTTAKGFKKRDMQRRKEIIAEAAPDLLISIHQNRYPSQKVRGGQVFYDKESVEGKELARLLQEKLNALYKKEGAKERKITPAEYFMLRCAPCPSVIIECGFLSNEEDERLLQSPVFQRELAEKLTAGTLAYFEKQSS